MAYVEPTAVVTNDLIDAAEWNQNVVDNVKALKSPPTAFYEFNEGSDYTTSSTTWADVDATSGKFNLSITTTGGDVMVCFCGTVGGFRNTTGGDRCTYFDILVDGATAVAGDDGIVFLEVDGALGETLRQPVTLIALVQGLSAGSHSFKLRWKVQSGGGAVAATIYAGAGTANYDVHPQFWVREI